MTKTQEDKGRARSTELSAGTGFTFEDAAGAYYLAALLGEGYAPGIENRIVSRVAFQQRSFKEPLDDLVVDFHDAAGEPARLSIQVKRALTISAATSNDDFREVIQNSWLTYQKDGFRKRADRYGVAVGDIAKDKARALISLCEKARESLTANDFAARFANGGDASAEVRAIRDDIANLLLPLDGRPRSESEMHEFLAHFVLVEFDFLHSGAVSPPTVMTQLRHSLAAGHENEAPLLWKTLCQTVRDSGGNAGAFDRPRLVRALSPIIRLRAAPSLRGDLEKLTELAQTWAADIANDVGGVRLDRKALSEELTDLLAKSRFVQIRGLPGSGKSVVLRQRLDAELQRGPVLFLKSDRLDGRGWTSFASTNGLSNSPLVDLLVEIEATGSNTLFIDGIDRIEKDHQPIVLDVLRAILKSPLLASWRIIVSLRDSGMEPLRNWLGEILGQTSVATLDVDALKDDEAETLAQAKPALRGLLFGPPRRARDSETTVLRQNSEPDFWGERGHRVSAADRGRSHRTLVGPWRIQRRWPNRSRTTTCPYRNGFRTGASS